jgi:hypothetical protein
VTVPFEDRNCPVVCFLLGGSSASEVHRYEEIFHIYLPIKMEQTQCSETLAYKLQTPVNQPEESMQHSEHGESLKSIVTDLSAFCMCSLVCAFAHTDITFSICKGKM